MQREFDWTRDKLLDRVRLPASAKAVLCRIARYPECWEKQDTIRQACGFRCKRTVQRALVMLARLDLVTTNRRWNDQIGTVVNHHRVNWEELRRRVDQSDIDYRPKRHCVQTKVTLSPDQSDSESPINKKDLKEETTTTQNSVVVVVFSCGVVRTEEAIRAARKRGLSDSDILDLVRLWREQPDQMRLPGVLFNWLALPGSSNTAKRHDGRRGDAMTPEQSRLSSIRTRIVKQSRLQGATEQEISQRCQAAGVEY